MALLLGTMIRVKDQTNGQSYMLSEAEFHQRDRQTFIETYRFDDCRVESDDTLNGINAAGARVTIEE